MAYIDALRQLELLVKKTNGANKTLLEKAEKIIKRSEDLQEEAYTLIAQAYQCASNNNLELEDSIHSQFVYMNNFNEFEKEKKDQDDNRENERQNISRLEPSGFTETNKNLHDYARKIVKYARSVFNDEPFIAHIWPYRWGGYSMVSCDLFKEGKNRMAINIQAVEQQNFCSHDDLNVLEIEVFDMAEALHLVGMVTQALDANVLIGLGRNEVNPDVLEKPLREGHTNGKINLWSKK